MTQADDQARAENPSGGALEPSEVNARRHARRHFRLGWWTLLVFLSFGFVLETLHGFKVGFYLDVSNEARRLTFRLAHAHGTLLAIVNIVFALTLSSNAVVTARLLGAASVCLVLATILMPAGFFVSGLFIVGGDPGLGILLVPLGAAALFGAVLLIARAMR
jgi:hypothetical protein